MAAPAAPHVAIFDFDGTIADSLDEAYAVYNAIAADLKLPTVSSQQLAQLRRVGPREALRELGIPLWRVPRIMAVARRELRARIAKLQPIAGMSEVLHELWRRGCRTAILSSNSRENIETFLRRHRLDRFEALSCGTGLFGKASRLRRMAARREFAGSKVFYVGDEVRDVAAADEAGIASVAVTWGFGDREALAAQAPDYLVDAPEQLLPILAPQP